MRFGGGRALSNLVPKYDGQSSEACSCDSSGGDYKLGLAGRRKLFKKSKCHRPAHACRRCSHGSGHVNFQTTPQMLISRPGGCPRSKGHNQSPHRLSFERAAVLGQATRRQCGQGPRPSRWGQLGPVGLVSSGAGRDGEALKPPSNDHSNGERSRQTVEGLTRSQVAWVNRSVQGGSG